MSRLTEVVAQIKPFVLGWISQAGGGAGPYAPSPHDIGGSHHTGSIADAQIPNALLRDGSRSLLGNLAVADTMTLDGVDLSVFKAAYDIHIGNASAHHAPVTIGTGGLSAKLGLATQVLTLAAIAHSDLSSIDSNQHIDHTTVSISAGTGLSGGGTIAASRSLSHGTGDFGDLHTNYTEYGTAETITAAWTHQADLVTRLLRPELTDTYDIGTSTYWYRQQFVSQINAVIFAEQQITLMGGWLYIPKDAGTFAAEVGAAATTINFGKAMTVGDFVLVKAYDKSATVKAEYILVGSLVSGTTYNVTRDLAGAHTTDPNWAQGTPYAVLGQSGNGRIELNAYDTPRVQIIQQGATYATQTELARLGDLNGNWGYSAQTYGLALGEYASGKANLTWDPTNGLRLRTYSTTAIQLDNAGNAKITGKLQMPETASALAIGATPPTAYNAGTGIWIDRTGLYSLNAGAFQIKIDATTGKLHTGGTYGAILDAVGISLKSGGIIGTGIGWYDITSGDRTAYVGGAATGQPAVFVQAVGTSTTGASADLSSSTTGYSDRTVYLSLVSNATPTAYLYLGSTLTTKINGDGLSAKRIVLNSYSTNPADTSRTFSDTSAADITGFTLNVVVPQTGCDVLIGWDFRTWSSNTDYSFHLYLMQDTRTVRSFTDMHRYAGVAKEYIGMTYLDRNQTAGTYTYKLTWAASGGTGHICYANSGHMYAVVSGVTVS